MLKNTTLLTFLLLSTQVSAVEIINKDGNRLGVYGKVHASRMMSDNRNEHGDNTYVRFGLRGETQINPQLTGYGNFQLQFQGSKYEGEDKHFWTRLAFAGVDYAQMGSFDYGRNWGVMYDLGAWTDVLPEFGAATLFHTDNFMAQRGTGLATYRNRDFFGRVEGLNFALQYQGKNEGSRTISKQNGDGWGISASYDIGAGVAIGGVYTHSARTEAQKNHRQHIATGDYAEAYIASLKYSANDIYAAALYGNTYNMTSFAGGTHIANKAEAIELVAKYRFDVGVEPSIGYLRTKGKNLQGYNSNNELLEFVNLGLMYYFNNTLSTYANYKINLLNKNDFTTAAGLKTDDTVVLGIVYQL